MSTINKIDNYLKQFKLKSSTEEFISIVSNIYHDFESATYDEKHLSIKKGEKYWRLASDFLFENFKNKTDLVYLDFGCGTGFASEQISNNKNLENIISKIYCYDLSESMINQCKKKFLDNQKFNFYSNKNGYQELLKENKKFDLITCNALLHHILEPDLLVKEFSDLLNKDGILIIGHEPNKEFYKSTTLQFVTQTYRLYKNGLNKLKKIFVQNKLNLEPDLINLTYNELLKQDLIKENFPKNIIPKLVDIHVPMGNLKKQPWGELGFDMDYIIKNSNKTLFLINQISYNHIKDQNAYNSIFWTGISNFFEYFYPKKGADTILIFKKI